MGKLGKKYFVLSESIFNRKVHVFLNWTGEEFTKFAHKKGATGYSNDEDFEKNMEAFSTTMSTKNGPDEWVIVLKHFDWTIGDQGSLIHEIVHTIIKIWHSNNINFNEETQEFLAHSIANLYEDICAKIFRKK